MHLAGRFSFGCVVVRYGVTLLALPLSLVSRIRDKSIGGLAGKKGFISVGISIHSPDGLVAKLLLVGLAGLHWIFRAGSIADLHPGILLRTLVWLHDNAI